MDNNFDDISNCKSDVTVAATTFTSKPSNLLLEDTKNVLIENTDENTKPNNGVPVELATLKESIVLDTHNNNKWKTESNEFVPLVFNSTINAKDDSLQQIRESVSQFFNENFDRLAKANGTGGISCSLGANYRCPAIAASEKSDSTFSTPPNSTPTRRLTATSLSACPTPIAIIKSSQTTRIIPDLKVSTKL